jgi:hypothetical protein
MASVRAGTCWEMFEGRGSKSTLWEISVGGHQQAAPSWTAQRGLVKPKAKANPETRLKDHDSLAGGT